MVCGENVFGHPKSAGGGSALVSRFGLDWSLRNPRCGTMPPRMKGYMCNAAF
jgi:hypothetical protein